ncbi:TetR family transcriptional regulator [Rhodobacterales bacterium HKCCE2091]|nr:TetR family transcriptional regulator [Rhodobacterales bacterium HKCCE2091]
MDYLAERVAGIRSSISEGRGDLVRDNRQKMVNAATRLFLKKGFHKTSTRDISVELGVSHGNIYQYISRKEDILLLMLELAVDDYNEALFGIRDEDIPPHDKLLRAIDTYYRILDRHRDKTSVLYVSTATLNAADRAVFDLVELDVTRFFEAIVAEGVGAGVFAAADAFLVAFDVVSLGHMWALKHHRFRGRLSLDDYIAAQSSHVLRMLG